MRPDSKPSFFGLQSVLAGKWKLFQHEVSNSVLDSLCLCLGHLYSVWLTISLAAHDVPLVLKA